MDYQEHQRIIDEEHLKLLRIAYFILGGTNIVVLFVGFMYMALGLFMTSMIGTMGQSGDEEFAAIMPIIMGVGGFLIVVFGGAVVALQFLAARNLKQRRGRVLCLWAAGLSCISMPWGTLVGVLTFNVLGRSSVQTMFDSPPQIPTNSDIPPPPNVQW